MAAWYVYSGAAGTASGADWTNAKTTLSAAITASSAGDTFYVAHDHSTNYGSSTTLAFKGSITSPDRIICVNRAGSVPPVAADITTGGLEGTNATNSTLVINGVFFCDGMTFAPGQGVTDGSCDINLSNSSSRQRYRNCLFYLKDTGSGRALGIQTGGLAWFENCKARFSNSGHRFQASSGGAAYWRGDGSSILHASSTTPASLLNNFLNGVFEVSDCDLSAISGTLIAGNANILARGRLVNCKIHASATSATIPTTAGPVHELLGCHSTSNVARNERYSYPGILTTETTIIRTAGASDGTTPFSWKIVPNSNNERSFPVETFEGVIWNDTTGSSKTLTVHIITDNVTLTDAEIWVEVEYLGDASYPVASFISDEAATILTTAANQASDSGEAWTTTGLTTPLKQKLEVTFTPQMAGPIRWRVKYAKTSTTVYVCPKADVA